MTQDGWQPVPPGGETTYRLRAEPFGVHPYHCDASPAAEHLSTAFTACSSSIRRAGRPPAHELVLVLSGFDLDGDGHNELYGWNGVAGFFERYPIKVPVGVLVRVYLLNMVADDPVASFHLHAETFDVYRSGTRLVPDERTDVVTLAQTERAIVEFRLPRRGRYMFHPHQRHMAERGAMGWFAAVVRITSPPTTAEPAEPAVGIDLHPVHPPGNHGRVGGRVQKDRRRVRVERVDRLAVEPPCLVLVSGRGWLAEAARRMPGWRNGRS